jgi:hypothetical protein
VTFVVEIHNSQGKRWEVVYRFSAFERLHSTLAKLFGGELRSVGLGVVMKVMLCDCVKFVFDFI